MDSDPTENPTGREDDKVHEEILRDMLLASREDLWELPRGTTPLESLDDVAHESGRLTLDERDAVYRQFLRQRVEELKSRLLGSSFGSYHIVEVIAAGGMGIVFKARQESPMFTRDVAMKFMISGTSTTEEDRERFISEVKGLAGLSHPSLVSIFDSGIKDHLYYFTMELIDGASLRELVREDRLGVLRKVEIVRDVALALTFLHESGVVHRDVKPGNIMVDREGVTKLLDFGIAQFSADARKRGIQAGTLHYMAPEIIDPSGQFGSIGPGVDIYALGAVLYYLLYGVEVFSSSTTSKEILECTVKEPPRFPRDRKRRVSPALERILRKALSKHVDRRQPSASSLAEDLDRYLIRRRSRGTVSTVQSDVPL